MKVIEARNVHCALPLGIRLISESGQLRESRNGPVLVSPAPVTTTYLKPTERLTFWPERDVNTAFLVYEALWMLAGRDDLAPVTRYVSTFGRYSDDGETLHGAYGHRWRWRFDIDQLNEIVGILRTNPDDRRCVLQMWNAEEDLGRAGRDVPCNLMATVQRDTAGALDLTVFCRSNDIIWGAYFANAFHFSVLQEYLALAIGCPVGVYEQVSVNWHAYLETFEPLRELPKRAFNAIYSTPYQIGDPYALGVVQPTPLFVPFVPTGTDEFQMWADDAIRTLTKQADAQFPADTDYEPALNPWAAVLRAHSVYQSLQPPERFASALECLALDIWQRYDIVASMENWIRRRQAAFEAKAGVLTL